MLTQRVHRLRRVRRVALDFDYTGTGPEPALEPHTTHGAGPDLHSEAGHHGWRAIRVCALDIPRPPASLSGCGCGAMLPRNHREKTHHSNEVCGADAGNAPAESAHEPGTLVAYAQPEKGGYFGSSKRIRPSWSKPYIYHSSSPS